MIQEIDIPAWKSDVTSMDYITFLPSNHKEHDSIWVIGYKVTKYLMFLTVKIIDFTKDYT